MVKKNREHNVSGSESNAKERVHLKKMQKSIDIVFNRGKKKKYYSL
jgi:hypothetical protein